jgi:16S rRNA (uracil1498-N3)-methyltransferase
MPPRLFVSQPLAAGAEMSLGDAATRHTQVLRLQPDDAVTLFDGQGGEWRARIASMGKRETRVQALEHRAIERELPVAVTLALAMPAGDRMDFVVEKATELGAAAVQPLMCERSVLRLAGERADRRSAHWQAIAVAACEQCGRNRVPEVRKPLALTAWLAGLGAAALSTDARWLLGWRGARAFRDAFAAPATMGTCMALSGPEGGFTDEEEQLALSRGFTMVSLGPRTLRADTAPLALLAAIAVAF